MEIEEPVCNNCNEQLFKEMCGVDFDQCWKCLKVFCYKNCYNYTISDKTKELDYFTIYGHYYSICLDCNNKT